jgi:hypothetical protein
MFRAVWILLLVAAGCDRSKNPPPVTPAPPEPAPAGSCLLDGASPCVSAEPISVLDGVLAWSDEIGGKPGATECRWVKELDDVLLCASQDTTTMNPLLTRAAMFIEAGTGVVTHDDPRYLAFLARIGGFDLRKDHPDPARPDMLAYHAAVDQACALEQAMCPQEPELAMRRMLDAVWEGRDRFVVITFARHGEFPDDVVVSHEILHAQFFTQPAYREVVEAHWAGLDEPTRAALRDKLAGQGYNPADEELMMNELQAYVLMNGGELAGLASEIPAHRPPLQNALRARGVEPLQTELRPPRPAW